jgi:ABC-type transport system involved in multi-copper enzyme maturation permease subunit
MGPNGEAVADSYRFVEQPLTGNGTFTAQVTSLTGLVWTGPDNIEPSLAHTEPGLEAWAKAGILVTPSTQQGSPYAAIMATGGHGIRWQYNYTHDQPGLSGGITSSAPRWLRLTRTGSALTGYDSANGMTWHEIGTADLTGLPANLIVGLFVTSPVSFESSSGGAATQATATFDHVTLNNHSVSDDGQSRSIGTGSRDYYPTLGTGSTHRSGNTFVLSGSGDIALAVNPLAGGDTASSSLWFGLIVALMMVIVVATMFITAEYRRGLLRTTFTATPERGPVLMAKAVVIGAVAFAVGALAAAIGVPLGMHVLNGNGNYVFPSTTLTEVRITAGSGALLALTAVAVLALGAILRKGASAITIGVVVFALPYLLGQLLSGSAQEWLFRITPAAGLDVLGALPRAAVVDYPSTVANGYYPLAPWAGLAVLGAYTAISLGTASFLLRRRDA